MAKKKRRTFEKHTSKESALANQIEYQTLASATKWIRDLYGFVKNKSVEKCSMTTIHDMEGNHHRIKITNKNISLYIDLEVEVLSKS